ncbi:ras-related protein Rab-3A [Gracilinanus agilis]|uniref:ras-related protein Rab-3A n=1 Tax=Gracilinanus agilis TaxID=191870 RepID=UPI001CFCE4E3|nr:ras-related protein Rab-3A [Gracilinanus agilis]
MVSLPFGASFPTCKTRISSVAFPRSCWESSFTSEYLSIPWGTSSLFPEILAFPQSLSKPSHPTPWGLCLSHLQMASATDSRYGQKESSDQNFDYMFKILIIGNSSVGKTSFLFRYADDSFTPAFVSTVGIDFKVKTIYRNEKRIKLQIWDTAGQERYRTITTAYYRGAMGFILMYDITNEESFNAVQDWSTQIKTYSWDNAQVLLVGNKCDMEDERIVSSERGRQLAEHLGFEFFEASAKDNINVKQTFERLVDIICEKMSESLDTADPAVTGAKQGPQLTDQQAPPHQDCAC